MCWRSDFQCYCWWKKSGDHHLGWIQPCKQWNKLPINWCRISFINSSTWTVAMGWEDDPRPSKKGLEVLGFAGAKSLFEIASFAVRPGCRSMLCSFRSAETCLFHPFSSWSVLETKPKEIPVSNEAVDLFLRSRGVGVRDVDNPRSTEGIKRLLDKCRGQMVESSNQPLLKQQPFASEDGSETGRQM